MINFFFKFLNGTPLVRNIPIISEERIGSTSNNSVNRRSPPAWIRLKCRNNNRLSEMVQPKVLPHHYLCNLLYILDTALSGNRYSLWRNSDGWEFLYTFAYWMPITAREALPFEVVPYRNPLIRSAVLKPGLLNLFSDSDRGWCKSLNLKEIIRYSYLRDMRFILCLCSMLGFSIWWIVAPEPLLLNPAALCSPDLSTLIKVVRETFIDQVCSSHPQVASPCDCGEPLNKTARAMFQEHQTFDPLSIDEPTTARRQALIKSLSVYIGCILLTMVLAESVSPAGVAVNLTPA